MDNEVLISHLLKRKEEASDILKFVKEWPRNGYSYVSKLGTLSIRYAEMKLETEIKWIDESIEALQKDNLPDGQDPHGNTEKLLNRRRMAIGRDEGN